MSEIRHAFRVLTKSPGFTITALVTLALGTGMNTAVFSLVNAVILRSLPYPGASRLISMTQEQQHDAGPSNYSTSGASLGSRARKSQANVSIADIDAYRRGTHSLEELATLQSEPMNLTGNGTPERLQGLKVSANFFRTLSVEPVLGRDFLPEEDRAGSNFVVVLSDDLWRRRFGSDPGILGRTILLDADSYRVIGVLPAGFRSPPELDAQERPMFYVPAAFSANALAAHDLHNLMVIGRLARGRTLAALQAELDAVSAGLGREFPATDDHIRATATPLESALTTGMQAPMRLLMGAAALALLIACVNVANLLLVRAIGRRREISVRFALGASRARVIAGFVTESLMLSLAGCVAGLLIGRWLMDVMVQLAPASIPRIGEVSMDLRVFAFSAALAVITGVAFGLFPAWQASRTGPGETIKASERGLSGRAQSRSRIVLVMAEVSMAVMLLVGAALLIKSFMTVLGMNLGFQTERVLAMSINLPPARYATPADRLRFFEELERRVSVLPGVQSVAFANRMPLRGGWGGGMAIEGREAQVQTERQAVNPRFFETLGIPVLRGRLLTPADRGGQPAVAVVDQTFANTYFPGQDPIGHRIRRVGEFMTIVGVVGDIRRGGRESNLRPQAYISALQVAQYTVVQLSDFAVRTAGDPRQVQRAIQEQVLAIDKDQPVTDVRTLEETLTASVAERRFQVLLLIAFAGVALALALIGIFGVLSHSVTQRTIELGIRVALGAPRTAIVGMVLKQAAVWLAGGLAIGLAGTWALSRFIAAMLFGVQPHDPAVYTLCAGAIALTAIIAAAIPARRASKVDPMVALRYE